MDFHVNENEFQFTINVKALEGLEYKSIIEILPGLWKILDLNPSTSKS